MYDQNAVNLAFEVLRSDPAAVGEVLRSAVAVSGGRWGMNRREALQAGLGVLSALSMDGEVATLSPRNPRAFVLSFPGRVSVEARCRLNKEWKEIFGGTDLADVPVIVLDGGAKLEVVDMPAEAT